MHAIRLPDNHLLIPVECAETHTNSYLVEITPDDLEYAIWQSVAIDGPDPRPQSEKKPTT
jgi:hypothetical protein